ncbi:MAG: HAD hydrolase-like protein [Chloroflexi bacterium]|nr:HAD hydrolase-like protein [Chloroflexota bacterium]
MPFRTLLLDTDDVLYIHPRPDRHLQDYLAAYDLQPRHPKVVQKALKAAHFDVLHGRIARQEYYDAILSFHGLPQQALEYGRSVLLADAAAIQPIGGAVETLIELNNNGLEIGIAANTEHPAEDLVIWLEDVGFPRDLWWMVMTSCEIGLTKPDPAFFKATLQITDIAPEEILYVGRDFYELAMIGEQGIMPLAFQPDNPENIGGSNIIHSYDELYQLVLG